MSTNNEKTNDWSKRDIGALWKREGQSQKYLSGYVKIDELGIESEVKIVVFSNKNKKDNAKAPDYRIYLSRPAVQQEQASVTAESKNSQDKKKPLAKKTQLVESEESETEDIL